MVGRDFGQLATASCGIGANCFQWKVAMKELNSSGEKGNQPPRAGGCDPLPPWIQKKSSIIWDIDEIISHLYICTVCIHQP